MPTITIHVGDIGGKKMVLSAAANLEEFDASKLETWVIESREVTARSLMDASDKAGDPEGKWYALKYNVEFANAHISSVTDPDGKVTTGGEGVDFDSAIPAHILNSYVWRADATKGCTEAEFESLKKPVPTEKPNS